MITPTIGQLGTYILPAIKPYCREERRAVRVIGLPRPGRVALQEIENPRFLIDTDTLQFRPADETARCPGCGCTEVINSDTGLCRDCSQWGNPCVDFSDPEPRHDPRGES